MSSAAGRAPDITFELSDIMVYLAFIFAFALACVAGMEFISLMTLETKNRQLQRRIAELERENATLSASLSGSEAVIAQHEREEEEETWPELIDDDSARW